MFVRISPLISFIAAPEVLGSMEATTIVTRGDPFQFSANEGDLWPVQARRAAVLAQSPLFTQPVISATGKMATMRTIDPRTFVDFKRWMANLEDREAVKRRRDALQADIVQEMLAAKMLTSAIK